MGPKTQADHDLQQQRTKLANSYQSLLSEFSSIDLQSVGNYSLGKLIGKGSFGKVYLASHKLTNGSKVVLKSAKKDDANLAREIHHHRQFLHPHIARLYEVIVTESLVWLVLEYCPGDELYSHLVEHGRMEAGQVQKIFTQLVGAVSYVHAKSCVHRDLKLENILLDKNGNVKLVDFGFTREYQGSTSYLQTWCGTVCYSAPEMLRGEKYAGEKVDVWSLGIILYALLCGELPFDEDDDGATKNLILVEDPKYPDYMPEPAVELIKKLLSKRPIRRPALSELLKDPWLAEYTPQQQEILKLQQPAPFSTDLEKDTLERMRSAGVDIDMVIEHVLSQRCDALAGWWALLIEKEQRKQKRRERKRKEREAEAKSIRRLSAASGRLLAQSSLGEIHEGVEDALQASPRSIRGRRLSRNNNTLNRRSIVMVEPELPRVAETKSPTPEDNRLPLPVPIEDDSAHPSPRTRSPQATHADSGSRSRSRPPPPPKDGSAYSVQRPRNKSRGSTSMLRNVTINPDLLSPAYVPPPERARKRKIFYQQPLKEQLSMFKHWFKENAKRAKSPVHDNNNRQESSQDHLNGHKVNDLRKLQRSSTGLMVATQHRKESIGQRPALESRNTLPARPRVNTTGSSGSAVSATRQKRQSLSPHTITPHSSYRRSSAGLRGRKSTSSSVSSIRTNYQQSGHQHSHSKASSTSSASVASPGGLSSASGSRLGRSPHSSVKVLPSTPTMTSTFPSGVRVSRRPPPAALGSLPGFSEARGPFGGFGPGSPGLPVFARRKRSVFKGPMHHTGSPAGFGRVAMGSGSRSGSVQGRRSGEIGGIVEEEEEEEVDMMEMVGTPDEEIEEVDTFGPELPTASGASQLNGQSHVGSAVPLPEEEEPDSPVGADLSALVGPDEKVTKRPPLGRGVSVPLTAEALAKKDEEDEKEEAQLEKVKDEYTL